MSEEFTPQTRRVAPTDYGRSRAADARVHDGRHTDERPGMQTWSPATALETPPPKGGYVFRWIAEYVNGAHIPRNVQMALREGYERVGIAELPDDFIVDEDTKGDGYARTGGLILMRMPEDFARQRMAYYRRRSGEALQAANELQGVAGKNAVYEDRGSRTLTGADGAAALRTMAKG